MKNYLFLLGLIGCIDDSERFSDYQVGKVVKEISQNEAGYFELIVQDGSKKVKLLIYDERPTVSSLVPKLEDNIFINSVVSFPKRNFGIYLFNSRDSCILPSDYLIVVD